MLAFPRPFRRTAFAFAAALAIAGCATEPANYESRGAPPDAERAERLFSDGDLDQAAATFRRLAEETGGDQSAHFRLREAEALRETGNLDAAARAVEGVKRRRLHGDETIRLDLLDAEVALAHGDAPRARALLTVEDSNLPPPLRLRVLELRSRAEVVAGDRLAAARSRAALDRLLSGADRAQNEREILDTLAALDTETLRAKAIALPPDDALRPWLEQALRGKGAALARELPRPNRIVGTVLSSEGAGREGYRAPRTVALLLPLSGQVATVAQSIRDGFFAAYYADAVENRPDVRVYDSGKDSSDAFAAYKQAVADGADNVVGPLQREAVGELFHHDLPARVLALNHPDTGEVPPPGSLEFGLLPDAEGAQAAEHMLALGIRSAAVLAADADWAERASLAFRAQFEAKGGHVVGESRLRENEVNFKTAILQAAGPLGGATDAGVFISMRPQQARLLLPQMKIAGVAAPVFATSHIYTGSPSPGLDRDLDGIEFCDAPWLFGTIAGRVDRSEIARTLPSASGVGARLFAFGMDAYALLPYADWLLSHSDAYVEGATGQLTADSFGRVHRVLTWARFDNGIAHPVQATFAPATSP